MDVEECLKECIKERDNRNSQRDFIEHWRQLQSVCGQSHSFSRTVETGTKCSYNISDIQTVFLDSQADSQSDTCLEQWLQSQSVPGTVRQFS